MRAYIVSDQHFEFRRDRRLREEYFRCVPAGGADLAIIAGDFDVIGAQTAGLFRRLCDEVPALFYLPGNHDYYGSNPARTDALLAEIEASVPNLTVLRTGEVHSFQGRRILGDTMWFPETVGVWTGKPFISDPYEITGYFPWVFERNAAFRAFLEKELREGDIVVTHHLPSDASSPPQYRRSRLQPYFVCDMEALIRERKPAVWIHGHTHGRVEYDLGETRVICNPAGYPGESGTLSSCVTPFIFEL